MSKVTVKTDLGGVTKALSKENFKRGQIAMLGQMMPDMNYFVPLRNGDLRDSVHISADKSAVVWDTPYAQKQYRGVGIFNYTTVATGRRWDLKAKAIYMSDWVNAFKKGAQL